MITDEHDPMCPTMIHGIDCDACDLIARVRADEREGERIIYGYNNGYEQGVKDERERAAERVEAAHAGSADENECTESIYAWNLAADAARGGDA